MQQFVDGMGGARLLAFLLLPVAVACGAGPRGPEDSAPAEPLVGPPMAPAAASHDEPLAVARQEPAAANRSADVRDEARRMLEEQIGAFRALDAAAFSAAYAEDVFVFGPTADEVLRGRIAAARAVDDEMAPLRREKHLTVTTTERRLGAEGEDLAWSLDDVVVAVGEGQSDKTPFRIGSVLARGPEGLRVVGQVWSITLPDDSTMPMAQAKRFPRPKPIADEVDEAALPVQTLIEELLVGRSEPKLEGRRDTFFSGTAPDEIAVGDQAIARLLASFTEATRAGRVKSSLDGGLFARTHGAGVLAAYHLDVQVPQSGITMPIRHFSLYLKQGETFRPVLAVSSFGFPDT